MRRLIIIGVSIVLVGTAAYIATAASDAPQARKQAKPAVALENVTGTDHVALDANKRLHEQVSLCNLLNALWLEQSQLEELIAVLEPKMTGITELQLQASGYGASEGFGAAMTKLLATLKDGEEADEKLRQRVNSYSGPGNITRLEYQQARRDAAQAIMPVLNDNQLIILGEYKPCLFNANDPLHPERVGQASGASRIVGMLTKARNAPSEIREERITQGLLHLAERSRKDTPFEINLDDEMARIQGLVDEALAFSDEEFALQVERIAGEISCYSEAKDQMLADHYNVPTGLRDHRIDKIANMIVIPGAVEILKAELAQRQR